MSTNNDNPCKYCSEPLIDCLEEGLTCSSCQNSVHVKCLKEGGVPGGLGGDIFFIFTCQECSNVGKEIYIREKMPWLASAISYLYFCE